MDCPQVDDLCPASALLGHSGIPRQQQQQTWPIALAQAGAADGAALPEGGKDAKKNLAFMGICRFFSRKRRTRGLQSFCTGLRLQIHAWKSWEMPNTRDLGERCSGRWNLHIHTFCDSSCSQEAFFSAPRCPNPFDWVLNENNFYNDAKMEGIIYIYTTPEPILLNAF